MAMKSKLGVTHFANLCTIAEIYTLQTRRYLLAADCMLIHNDLRIYTVSQKNAPTLASCSFDKHGLILIIFGKLHQHTFRNDACSTFLVLSLLLTLFAFK